MASVRTPDDKDTRRELELDTTITLLKPTPVVTLSVPAWFVTNYKIPGFDDQLPDVLQYLCLAYADYLSEEKAIYRYPTGTTFFTRHVSQIQYRLEQAADDLLKEGKIDIALALVKANGREVLNVPTCGRDRFGTRIEGRTLLEMAGMGSDVNLREKKAEEKEDHGAVELLKQAAGFTEEEVANKLFPVLFSEEAKSISDARKNHVLTVLIEFAENILKRKKDLPKTSTWSTVDEFKAAQTICQSEINKLRKDLLGIVSNQTITAGYILDSQIFVDLTQWFEKPENFKRFDSWWSLTSDLFWVNGYGSLQYVATARDAQVCQAGIGRVVDDKVLPARSLHNSGGPGSSHFVPSSKLGVDFFLGFYGGRVRPGDEGSLWWLARSRRLLSRMEILCRAKTRGGHCKIYATLGRSSTNEDEQVLSNVKCR